MALEIHQPKFTDFDDLELWWPLDGNYSDMSGNGRNATAAVNESNPWQEGRCGQAFTFTGNDHLESIESPLSWHQLETAARTLSMWIKTTDKKLANIGLLGT